MSFTKSYSFVVRNLFRDNTLRGGEERIDEFKARKESDIPKAQRNERQFQLAIPAMQNYRGAVHETADSLLSLIPPMTCKYQPVLGIIQRKARAKIIELSEILREY